MEVHQPGRSKNAVREWPASCCRSRAHWRIVCPATRRTRDRWLLVALLSMLLCRIGGTHATQSHSTCRRNRCHFRDDPGVPTHGTSTRHKLEKSSKNAGRKWPASCCRSHAHWLGDDCASDGLLPLCLIKSYQKSELHRWQSLCLLRHFEAAERYTLNFFTPLRGVKHLSQDEHPLRVQTSTPVPKHPIGVWSV